MEVCIIGGDFNAKIKPTDKEIYQTYNGILGYFGKGNINLNRAQVFLIKRSIENFNWTRAFEGLSVNDQVELLNDSLLNILRNFIPHENVKCSSKDPPWMNKEIKGALRHKNRIYKKYISDGRKPEDEANLKETSSFVSDLIADTKSSYFQHLGKRLNDPFDSSENLLVYLKQVT